ncbi:hypothetical protein BDZ97DRAFT_1011303 [Flammula alnicola]|nr:hypothetical protein BDZ97DRAFT_1011303 [Flammula alnicola]
MLFPLQLVQPIPEHLETDKGSLRVVSLSSEMFRLEGQHILFKSMTGLANAIIGSQRLAMLVERYFQEGLVEPGENELWQKLVCGLREMKRLKHLKFQGLPAAQILRGRTFQLENLHWGCNSPVSILPSTCPGLIRFEGNQRGIEAFLPR